MGEGNPNGASIRFLVEGADLPPDSGAYQRMVILFDGTDVHALARARDQWRDVKKAGHDATYWQQDERGRWRRKA
jgi:DNA polymerase-3 subunit chi